MYTYINELLTASEVDQIAGIVTKTTFVSGAATASGAAKNVKNNEQLQFNDVQLQNINHIIQNALVKSPLFREATFVRHILPFMVSRYLPGMEYGWHVDSPLMSGGGGTIRADLSMTIFLTDPAEYEGGELEIESDSGLQKFKLPKGHAIIYPTTKLHRVAPVTQGLRLVAISWLQSFVKDTEKRDMLFQLKALQEMLNQQQQGSQVHLSSQQIYSNLLRMFCEA
ncbi:Fe2+-dependent dioxygenase [Mucilaginibacter sp. KACC 22063]|uniref:Fe2+-dependent dioxygenase n=1 Tax=Mucilaginibacter sp. KACC 22063 TaxID=3025666 RepID=UPI00236593CE|nr:Fe2+-dependent dioxygenase [Mucilaginibacter sp. KACC 22063]WDF53915.1 Fe2+-dependent dioxygenase [Mucilaginibacter sp. KACC 22063]